MVFIPAVFTTPLLLVFPTQVRTIDHKAYTDLSLVQL